MTPKRIEFTLPPEMWDRIERVRGDVPRATWIKRAVEARLAERPHEWFPIVGSESATQCKLCGKAGVDWDKRNALAAAEFERVNGGALESALESALGGAEEPVRNSSGRAASAPARASVDDVPHRHPDDIAEYKKSWDSPEFDQRMREETPILRVQSARDVLNRQRQERLNKRKS